MKKILLIAILLSISSSVGASTNFYLTDFAGNDEIVLNPSNTVGLLLWYTGDPILLFDVEVDVTGPGTILGGEITATGRNPELDDILMPGSVYEYDIELAASAGTGSLGSGISNPLAAIDFHCDGIGDVTLDWYNIFTCDSELNEIIPICHGMIIHQVPEPATMVLLGLGGLLLSRRR